MLLLAFLLCGATVVESAREIPLVREMDVLVVGGSSAGVTAAIAAKESGADVCLVAPRSYLGDDLAGTLRLALEDGETPKSELEKAIWTDCETSVPFTYSADAKSVAPQVDTGVKLCDGRADDVVEDGVQYREPKVKLMLRLEKVRHVDVLDLTVFRRNGDFDIAKARIVTCAEDGKWSAPMELKFLPGGGGYGFGYWRAELNRDVSKVGLALFRKTGCRRMILGEIALRANVSEGRLRVPSPLQVKQAFDRALIAHGIPCLTGSYASDVLTDSKGRIAGVVFANRSGRQAIRAKTVVDATERATVARLAGVPFTPYPAGPATFRRIVISGEEPKAAGMRVRELPGEQSVLLQNLGPGKRLRMTARAWECTLSIPMKDASYASFAEAEQIARDLTFTTQQLDAADSLFQVPPDKATDEVPHLMVLGGCSGLGERDLRPLRFMAKGSEVGRRAAKDARSRVCGGDVAVAGLKGASCGASSSGTVMETLNGLRSYDSDLPSVKSPARELPVLGSYDVVVVGGGTGGAPAGIGAARRGVRTLVIEELHGLGGVGTLGMIGQYWYGNCVGFTAECDRGVEAMGTPVRATGKREWWRKGCRDAGADVWFGALACGAYVEDGCVRGVIVATPSGRGVVLAKCTVDATGSAAVAAAAGARCEYVGAGEIALQGAGLAERRLGASYVNSDWGFADDTDALDVCLFALRGRLGAGRVWDITQVIDSRERRRIVGAGTVTPLDLLNHRTFPDTIVRGRSDFDSHGPSVDDVCFVGEAAESKIFEANLPYRALVPEKTDGILVAGLAIGVHRDALPLLRMQPEVQNTGYAAGVAAAMAVKRGVRPRELDVKELQRHLVSIGGLPEDVLRWKDNLPVDDRTWSDAVRGLGEGYKGIAVVLTDRIRALPALREEYARAVNPTSRLVYAHVLGILGDATGAETLARQIDGRDPRIVVLPSGAAVFGRRMCQNDSLIVALGRTKSPLAITPLLAELAKVNGDTDHTHVRALSLACEAMSDPRLAPSLAAALRKEGVGGWARAGREAITPAGGFGTSVEGRLCQRELNLARALLACGDSEGLAIGTFTAYSHDGRGVYARHARAVLERRRRAP